MTLTFTTFLLVLEVFWSHIKLLSNFSIHQCLNIYFLFLEIIQYVENVPHLKAQSFQCRTEYTILKPNVDSKAKASKKFKFCTSWPRKIHLSFNLTSPNFGTPIERSSFEEILVPVIRTDPNTDMFTDLYTGMIGPQKSKCEHALF